jgi:hypothetical protein
LRCAEFREYRGILEEINELERWFFRGKKIPRPPTADFFSSIPCDARRYLLERLLISGSTAGD